VIDLIETESTLKVAGLPSSGRVSFLHQEPEHRYVAHLLYSPALQRGDCKVIEDFPTIPRVTLQVRVPEHITKVRTIPDSEALVFSQQNGLSQVAVPTFTMHTGVVFEYEG
jgi:hypothetical protein